MNDDSLIIQKVTGGDREAYAELVRRYQARIIRLCQSFLHNSADAEDAAQEVFIKAFESLGSFQKSSAFYTWLYRIASNHCLGLLRSKKRKLTESWDALLESQGEKVQELFSASADPRQSRETAELVGQLLSQLKPNHRTVLTLCELEGLSYAEISDILECSLDSVKAQIRRARVELEEKTRHFLSSKSI